MIMDVNQTVSNESEDEENPLLVKLKKDLRRAQQNDKLKTELLNKLTKTVKSRDERLAELEAKVASNDDEKRQQAETASDELADEVKTLKEKMARDDILAKEEIKGWKEKAAALSDKVTLLEGTMLKEAQQKEEKLSREIQTLHGKILHNENLAKDEVRMLEEKHLKRAQAKEEELTGEIQILKDQITEKDVVMKKTGELWREQAEIMTNQAKILEDRLALETKAKEELEPWREKYEALSLETKTMEEKLLQEQQKHLEHVESMSQQKEAHKEQMTVRQESYRKSISALEMRTDGLIKEAVSLKEANLVLQAIVDKSHDDINEFMASTAALKSLDQDQRSQIQKLQEEVSSLQSAKAEFRRLWVSAANKNQSFREYIKEERTRTLSELSYWKDMNERLYDSFKNNEKLLQEARDEVENLKSMQDAWKLQVNDGTIQLESEKARIEHERFELNDQILSLARQNANLKEEQAKLTITKEEFREQAEQATERIQQLELKVDTLIAQGKPFQGVEAKRKELQESLDELQARYDHLSNHYKECLEGMKEERSQFKENYDSLLEDYKDATKNFVKARNIVNKNAALFVASEMRRQAQVLLDETARATDKSKPEIPPDFIVERIPSCRDDGDADDEVAEEKKLDDQATAPPLSVTSVAGVDSMFSFESTKIGEDEESVSSEDTDDDDTADDLKSMHKAELWFWSLLEGNDGSKDEDQKKERVISPRDKFKKERKEKKGKVPKKNQLKFL